MSRAEDDPKLKCVRATQINACSATNCDMAQDKCTEDNEQEVCWICLDGQSPDRQLQRPCKCPRFTHAYCLARWQLQMAGSPKEHFCEFCKGQLPDWKNVLTPVSGCCAPAVMNVNFNGRTYSFEVKPGPDGYRHFTRAIRQAFRLPDDSELNITFTCDEPTAAGSLLTLQGPGAYDAAVHCASVSAARRSSSSGTPSSTSLDGSTRGVSPVSLTQIPSMPRTPRAKAFANMGRRLKTALADLFFLRAEMPPVVQPAAQPVA